MGLKYTKQPNNTGIEQQVKPLQKLHYYILEKCSELFEWDQTRKTQFVAAFCAFTVVSQIIVISVLTHLDLPPQHALHPLVKQHGVLYLFFSFVLYLSLMFLGVFIKHTSDTIKDIYCFLVLLAYGIGALIITYFLGALSMASGVTSMMSPLMGLILFRNSMVLLVSACVLPIAAINFALIATSKIPYTLLIETSENLHQNTSMLASMYITGAPFLLISLFVAYACIERWKQRENIVRTLSTTDSLTALANRSVLLNEIQSYLSRPRMHRKTLSLMMMDLDNFKQINDRFGHLMGDEVLKNVSNTLKSITREDDLVVRYGGEEFCILLPDTHKETAEAIARRILIAIQETTTHKNGHNINVTTSIGLTTASTQQLNSGKVTIDVLLGAIDDGMYTAKDMGKNEMYFNTLPINIL